VIHAGAPLYPRRRCNIARKGHRFEGSGKRWIFFLVGILPHNLLIAVAVADAIAVAVVVQRTMVGRHAVEGGFCCFGRGTGTDMGHRRCVGHLLGLRSGNGQTRPADDVPVERLGAGIVFGFHGVAVARAVLFRVTSIVAAFTAAFNVLAGDGATAAPPLSILVKVALVILAGDGATAAPLVLISVGIALAEPPFAATVAASSFAARVVADIGIVPAAGDTRRPYNKPPLGSVEIGFRGVREGLRGTQRHHPGCCPPWLRGRQRGCSGNHGSGGHWLGGTQRL